jgi:hypothetical protein
MAKGKVFSGFNKKTAEKLLLDAGAFFKNFVVGTDTFESAITAGKLIGATSGGGTFKAAPETRRIEVDGVKGPAKGLTIIDGWDVSLMANVKEVSPESIKMALGAATIENGTPGYKKISGNNYILDEDYLENVCWIGKLSGSNMPVIIVVKNAIALNGLNLIMKDKNEGLIPTTFTGYYDSEDLDSPPFEIHYPDSTVE